MAYSVRVGVLSVFALGLLWLVLSGPTMWVWQAPNSTAVFSSPQTLNNSVSGIQL